MWTYRTSLSRTTDLQGLEVEARDGSIGKIDEATDDVGTSCVVVDTGPWIFGRKVVLPAGTIENVDFDGGKVVVGLTKEQIKDSPEYDPERFDQDYRDRLGTYYARNYSSVRAAAQVRGAALRGGPLTSGGNSAASGDLTTAAIQIYARFD